MFSVSFITNMFKELQKRMFDKNVRTTVLMLVATGFGILGGLPEPPLIFSRITRKFPLLKWTLVWVLLLQGAGGFDPYWSLLGTGIMFAIFQILYLMDRVLL